jgi:hypothetical protein
VKGHKDVIKSTNVSIEDRKFPLKNLKITIERMFDKNA